MVNWNDFDYIHVIKKLKKILASWWGVDVIFTDENGVLKGRAIKDSQFISPINRALLAHTAAREDLSQIIEQAFEHMRSSKTSSRVEYWPAAGFHIVVSPTLIDGNILGAVVVLGFLKNWEAQDTSSHQQVQACLEELKLFDNAAQTALPQIQAIDTSTYQHFLELSDLMAQEIVTLHQEINARENRIQELSKELGSRYKYDNMIGKSKSMQRLYNVLDKIKASQSTVLVQGENGTGKELIAKSIHYNSARKDKAFVVQNCSSFNDNLLESELFGHVKGAFTGAHRNKKGLFEAADRGTFFLDEIGDTSPTMQVKLLRVLQDGSFIPIGSVEPKKVDVRIIAATNKNLKQMVEDGSFREDLYYRLNVINIQVPPLRDRQEDIPLLAEYFLNSNPAGGESKKTLSKALLAKLFDYSWPGNVRELQNEIERLLVLAGDDSTLPAEALSDKIFNTRGSIQSVTKRQGTLKEAVEALERDMIEDGLRRTGWNKSKLAKELGVSRAGLIMKVEKYELDKRKNR